MDNTKNSMGIVIGLWLDLYMRGLSFSQR
jgi:hypothetical protein